MVGRNVSRGAKHVRWGTNAREDLRGHRAEAQELGVGRDMTPLWGRKPCYSLALGFWLGWIEDAKQDSVDVGCVCGSIAWGLKVCNGYLDIDGSDLVGTGVIRKRWYGIDFVQIVSHLFGVSRPLCV